MKHRVTRLDPLQSAKTIGLLYTLIALVIVPVLFAIGLMSREIGGAAVGLFGGLLMVLLYGVAAFVMGAILALLYNFVAKITGGFEMDLEPRA